MASGTIRNPGRLRIQDAEVMVQRPLLRCRERRCVPRSVREALKTKILLEGLFAYYGGKEA